VVTKRGCQIVIEKRGSLGGKHAQIAFDGFEDALNFAGADDGVDFGYLFEDLGAVAFDQAAGDDQFFGSAKLFCARPFQGWRPRILFERLR